MQTTTINPEDKIMTLINTFEVDTERQQELTDLLIQATEEVMKHLDGFISANLHMSIDGKFVTNYAQWESQKKFTAMLEDPSAQLHMLQAAKIANKFTPTICTAIHSSNKQA